MNVSHPSVHPVEVAPLPPTDGRVIVPPLVRMKVIQGMPGTIGGRSLRFCQFAYAVVSLVVMSTTSDFPSVTAFCYLVAAVALQSLWSLSLAILDIHALLVGRTLQNYRVVSLFSIGDGVTSTLTFAAACASAGITVLIDYIPPEGGQSTEGGQIYIKGHTRKKDNGKIVSKKVSEVMASLQAISGESSSSGSVDDVADFSNDDYSQVKGPEKSGYIRCVGRMPAVKKVASSRKDPDPTMEELKNVMGVMGAMIHQHYPNSNLLEVLNKMNIKIPSCNSSAESRNVSG